MAASIAVDWEPFVTTFIETYFIFNPTFAVKAGRHAYDGKLPDWSPASLNKQIAWLHSERKKALSYASGNLTDPQRIERDYLVSIIDDDLFWLEVAQEPYKNPHFYAYALDPNVYLTRDYAPLAERLRAYSTYSKAVPGAVEHIRHNLRTPLPRSFIDHGQKIFGGYATYYEHDAPTMFAAVKDSRLQTEFHTANMQAVQAMKDLAAWLGSQRATATENFALGPERFRVMLQATDQVELPLDRIEQAGRADLDRNLKTLQETCSAYLPNQPIPACIAKVQATKPETSPVEEARRQLPELKNFILAKNLVTIPSTNEARVAESPPYQRWNPAYIDIPGPFETGLPSFYYVAPPDPAWSPIQRAAYLPSKAVLLFISAHEVWPGHFLQHLHAHRVSSKLGQLFNSYAFAEGWAHYAEELMWEAGYGAGDPEMHIGQVLNALLRDVRLLCAIGMHTEGMTISACETMFREKAYQDDANARQQAERGTFDPAYLNYTLGKLMIRKLREDWTNSRGGRQTWRDFHDRFLSYGGPPIPLMRKVMLGETAGAPL